MWCSSLVYSLLRTAMRWDPMRWLNASFVKKIWMTSNIYQWNSKHSKIRCKCLSVNLETKKQCGLRNILLLFQFVDTSSILQCALSTIILCHIFIYSAIVERIESSMKKKIYFLLSWFVFCGFDLVDSRASLVKTAKLIPLF